MEQITKEEFEAYEKVRVGGKTNMFDVDMVCGLSEGILSRDVVYQIMKNYGILNLIYPGVKK